MEIMLHGGPLRYKYQKLKMFKEIITVFMGFMRNTYIYTQPVRVLTFRHRVSCVLGQAFHYSPENAFYIFNQQIYFITLYLHDRASLI